MPRASIAHAGGDRFIATIRGHVVQIDQPESDGGTNTGPTPTELFVASLASCVAFYARRYLQRHGLPEEGLAVTVDAEYGAKPSRIASMTLLLTLPAGVPEDKREAVLAVASHCTIGNTLTHEPEVSIRLT